MSKKLLKQYCKSINIASKLEDSKLLEIGQQVLLGFQEDLSSNQEWLTDIKRIEELASLKTNKKSTPLPDSSNIKLPIITKACYEYVARATSEIIQDDEVVKARIVGKDPNGFKLKMGQRKSDFMNYQLLLKNGKWISQLKMLLYRTALIGFICKKSYYDPVKNELTQVICKPDELIIHAESTSLEDAPRISHVLNLRINDVVERLNTTETEDKEDVPVFLEKPSKELIDLHKTDTLNKNITFIEQSTYLDLDDDGYKEPYIVTVDKANGNVFRIVTAFDEDDIQGIGDDVTYICRDIYYEDYHFLPNPKGLFQSVGFGILLLHLNEAANSTYNMISDAGQLANIKGGYIDSRLLTAGGDSNHEAGEFKKVKVAGIMNLKDGILPLEFGEPSSVLYQLMEMLIEITRDLTSTAQINNGTQSSENAKTGATLAIQEKGEKLFDPINENIYLGLTKEFGHIAKLNGKYLSQDEYNKILDDPLANVQKDFLDDMTTVIPMADPRLSSSSEKNKQAAIIQGLMQLPGIDPIKCTGLILDRIAIPDIKSVQANPNTPPPPNPEMLKLQAVMEKNTNDFHIQIAKVQQEVQQMKINAQDTDAGIKLKLAQAAYYLAQAETQPAKVSVDKYKADLNTLSNVLDTHSDNMNQAMDRQQNAQNAQSDRVHATASQLLDQNHQQTMQQNDISAQQTQQDTQQDAPQDNSQSSPSDGGSQS